MLPDNIPYKKLSEFAVNNTPSQEDLLVSISSGGANQNVPISKANLITSVNGQTGDISLDADGIGADVAGSAAQALEDAKDYTDQEVAAIDTGVQTVTAGTNVTISGTATNPVINSTGGGAVDSVNDKTGVVVLDADDISDSSTTNKFVTSAEKTKLSNLSGTNTGDQTTITGNAGTATKLQTARNINGVAFDGTTDIIVADSTKVPTTTTVNGHTLSSNVTVSKGDVGLGNVTNDAQLKSADLDTDSTLAANSDTKIASQKAVKAYADNNFVDLVSDQDIGGSKNFNGGIITATNIYDDSAIAFTAYYGGVVGLHVDGVDSSPNLYLMGYDSSINFGSGGDDYVDTKIYRTDVNELSFDGAKLVDTRRLPRVYSSSSTSSLTPDISENDQYCLTALATGLTINAPIGSPQDGEKLLFRIKDDSTARAITWDANFVSSGTATLPTTTVAGKTHMIDLIYDSTAVKWVCMAVDSAGY